MGVEGIGAGNSLHEFTRGSLWAESHEVIHTDDSPCVPMPTQGTCGAKRQVTETIPSSGLPLCPSASQTQTTVWSAKSKSRASNTGFDSYLQGTVGRTHNLSNTSFFIKNAEENAAHTGP